MIFLAVLLAAAPVCNQPALAKVASRLPGLPWDFRDSEAARGVLTFCTGVPVQYRVALETVSRPWAARELEGDPQAAAAGLFCKKAAAIWARQLGHFSRWRAVGE